MTRISLPRRTSTMALRLFGVGLFLLLSVVMGNASQEATAVRSEPKANDSTNKANSRVLKSFNTIQDQRHQRHLQGRRLAMLLLQRALALGDFDTINEVAKDMEFTMPDPEPVETNGVRLQISNIVCSQLYIGDLDIQWSMPEPETPENGGGGNTDNIMDNGIPSFFNMGVEIPATLDAKAIDLICSTDYTYWIFGFPSSGTAQITTSNNNLFSAAVLTSDNSKTPTSLDITDCVATVTVDDLEFVGQGIDLAGSALNLVEPILRGAVADVISGLLCDLVEASDETFDGFLNSINEGLDPYISGPPLEQDLEAQHPLSLEAALELEENHTIMNFENPTSTLATLGLTMARGYGETLGQIDNETGLLEINALVHEFTEEPGVLEYEVPPDVDGTFTLVDGVDFEIKHLTLRGIDRFTNVSFYTIGNYTWQGNVAHEGAELQVEADLTLRAPEVDKEVVESITLVVPVGPVEASVSLMVLLDQAAVGLLPLGALMNMDDTVTCVLSTIQYAEVSNMKVSPLDLKLPQLSGFVSPGLGRVARSLVELLYTGFLPSIAPAVDRFLHTTVLEAIEDAWRTAVCPDAPYTAEGTVDVRDLLLAPAEARAMGASGESPYGSLAVLAKDYIDEQLAAAARTRVSDDEDDTGSSLLNEFLGPRGSFTLEGNVVNISEPVWDEAFYLDLQLRDVMIQNIDSVGEPIALADPIFGEPYMLRNLGTFGLSPKPLHLNLTIDLALAAQGDVIRNVIFVDAMLETSSIVADIFMRLSEQKLFRLPLEAMLDVSCLLSTFHTPTLDDMGIRVEGQPASLGFAAFDLLVGNFTFNVSCVECDSPDLYQMPELLSQPGAKEEATQELRNLFDFLFSFVEGERSLVQGILDRSMVDASRTCPYSADFDPDAEPIQYSVVSEDEGISSLTYLGTMLAVMAVLGIVGVVAMLFTRWVVSRRNRIWLSTLPPEKLLTIYRAQVYQRERDAQTNALSSSIFASNQVPALAKYFVPVMVFGNIALFLSGHLSEGGAVRVYVSLAGKQLIVDDLYTFAVAPTVLDMWRAGAQSLSAIMFVASVAWPYTKQLITLFAWFVPPERLSLSRRGSILLWLDFLGKFSILDVFVLMGALVAFRLTITSPQRLFLPEGLYQIDLLVALRWGLYANMIAQVISQIGSHFIIHYHRRVEEAALAQYEVEHASSSVTSAERAMHLQSTMETSEPNAIMDPATGSMEEVGMEPEIVVAMEENNKPSAASLSSASLAASGVVEEVTPSAEHADDTVKARLYESVFRRPHRVECNGLQARKGVNAFVIALTLISIALVLVGCSLDSFSTEVQGLVGIIKEAGKETDQSYQSFSVFDVVQALWEQTEFLNTPGDKIGIIAVCALAIFTTVVSPICLAVGLLFQWLCPLGSIARNRLAVAIEVFEAWQYLEVYILSLVVGVWQLGSVSEAMGDAYCLEFDSTLSQLAFYGIVSQEDSNCFRIQSSLDTATYILIAAVVLLALLRAFVVLAFRQVRFQKSEDEKMQRVASADHKVLTSDEEALSVKDVKPLPVLFSDRFRWLLESA